MQTDTFSFSAGIFKRKREVDAKQSPGKGIVHFFMLLIMIHS